MLSILTAALTAFLSFPVAPVAQESISTVLELERGDVVCLLGNALAERMQHHGWLETRLQDRFPQLELTVRNLGFSADELNVHQRTMNFGKFSADGMELTLDNERFVPWDRYLEHCGADVVFAFFGYNESFAGEAGIPAFRDHLESFIDHIHGRTYGDGPAQLVLFGSIPHEDSAGQSLPSGRVRNASILAYNGVLREVAAAKGVRFVDLYSPMVRAYSEVADALTINGIHLTDQGDARLAEAIDTALFGRAIATTAALAATELEALRAAILDKNLLWFNRYRATDGYNVYGGRSRKVYAADGNGGRFANFDVLQRELDHIDALCANRDRRIWQLARGEDQPVDDSSAPPLLPVLSNAPGAGPQGAYSFLRGPESPAKMTTAPGMRVELFADEQQFPELVNPVQMAWDTRGRLWVAVWPTYPHWTPGQPMNDKLLVLEDEDGDGRADTCTAFADDLHNPTGFEFWNGGVLLAAAPDLLFLEDTDGDGRADRRERMLHGLSSADTHHAANSFVLGPDGALYFQEGTFHMSQVESVYGPVRNRDGCVWRFHPRSWRVERYVPYNFANPHGHAFDRWGQDFVTDGTGNVNYYALPFSGHLDSPGKHASYFPFFQQRSRPSAGTEILSSAHFPDANQGNYLIANVIGFQGIFQYRVVDDGSGFGAVEVDPIVESTDRNFRPSDLEVGPDGALYFLDWHNPLIGHLQHHLRDPSRDATHGRVYRVTCEGRALSPSAAIAGEPIEALLGLLRSSEDRVRYRARIELSGRNTDEVVEATARWVSELDAADPDHEHNLLEALWLHQQHDRMDRGLLLQLLAARDPRARAAATRVLRHARHQVPDAVELLLQCVQDENPRVRLEAVIAASFLTTPAAVDVALAALNMETDRFLDYAIAETIRALDPVWRAALREGQPVASRNPAGVEFLLGRVDAEELAALPRIPAVLDALLGRHGVDETTRREALAALAHGSGQTPGSILLAAIERRAEGGGMHAAHVIHELAPLLLEALEAGVGPVRSELEALALSGALPMARGVACAGLIQLDDSLEPTWSTALESHSGLMGMLAAAPFLADGPRAGEFYRRTRPLLFEVPEQLDPAAAPAGNGFQIDYYQPAPADARLETFAQLEPSFRTTSSNVTVDLPGARDAASFGLALRATFRIAEGEYTFHLGSDDGSRLYIDERCVVDNDGDHSFETQDGSLYLDAGTHTLLLTYFDSGGDEGLELTFEGAGYERQAMPAELFLGFGLHDLRAASIRALASLPGDAQEKCADAARLIREKAFLHETMALVRSVPPGERTPARTRPIVDGLLEYVSGLPPSARSTPQALAALELGRDLARAFSEADSIEIVDQLDQLGGTVIVIRTLRHQMLYDLSEFSVEAGKPVSLVFENNDLMPHNIVITVPGAMETVGRAAEAMTVFAEAQARAFVPDTDQVLWHSRLVFPGESESISFTAPAVPGDHPYVCTYPGHWRVMNGVMHVVAELQDAAPLARRADPDASAAPRAFVRDWTALDLEASFVDNWRDGRSHAQGRALFKEAGCVNCHTVAGEGAVAGPELTSIQNKYAGLELLAHILDPSKEVLEDYVFQVFELDEGPDVTGRVIEDDGGYLHVVERLLLPDEITRIAKEDIVQQWETALSPMPSGLLVTFTPSEILDLVNFLEGPNAEQASDPGWVEYPGSHRSQKHIVLIAGDEEYRSEEAMPMLAKILAERHGFRCTVLFSTDPETGEIDPENQTHIPGIELLDEADMLVCFLRFRELPDRDMQHFVRYVEAGKPLLGIRTATHAFAYSRDKASPFAHYGYNSTEWPGGFGQQVLGDTWISHHGKHGSQSTRGVVEELHAAHPILRGVDDVWGPTDVYEIRNLPADAQVLLRGQVLEGMEPTSAPVAGVQNDPMMPLVWLRERPVEGAEPQRVIGSTLGASIDLKSEGLRRLFVNACYWGLGLEDEIPERSDVDPVGDYRPTPFGFGKYTKGIWPVDHALR